MHNVQSLQDFQSSLPETSKMVMHIMSLADFNHFRLDLAQVVAGHVGEKLQKVIVNQDTHPNTTPTSPVLT